MVKTTKTQASVKKRPARKQVKAPPEYVFWCHDGSVYNDLDELAAGLMAMSDETFAYHSNQEKHDFSNWVRDILEEDQLADALAEATCRLEAIACLGEK
jgi:hypothetical protein